jgi:superfamily II DNA/RNA helicase
MTDTFDTSASAAFTESVSEIQEFNSFDEMGLSDDLLRGVYSYGFEKPSAIQKKAIVPMVQGRDIIAQAQSGTGKTGTFVIGSLSQVDPTLMKPQVLVLVNVHELAEAHSKVARAIGSKLGIRVMHACGGVPLRDNIRALEEGVHFIAGTPGRVYDLINRGVLDRSHMKVLILDEADQMLEDLFYKQVMAILEQGFPQTTRVALFSATWPPKLVEVANKILDNPVRILIPPKAVRLDGIQQFFIGLDREDHKFDCICDLYKHLDVTQAVIFCNKRQKAEMLAEKMQAHGYPLTCIHGELPTAERSQRFAQFLEGSSRILIATDVMARGIDIQQISMVLNYELPTNINTYVHRIGRAGRYGRKGTTINLLLPEEEKLMAEISEHYGMSVKPLPNDLSCLNLNS